MKNNVCNTCVNLGMETACRLEACQQCEDGDNYEFDHSEDTIGEVCAEMPTTWKKDEIADLVTLSQAVKDTEVEASVTVHKPLYDAYAPKEAPKKKSVEVIIDESSPLCKTQQLCDSCAHASRYEMDKGLLVHKCGYRIFDDMNRLCWPCPSFKNKNEVSEPETMQYDETLELRAQADKAAAEEEATYLCGAEEIAEPDGMADSRAEYLREASHQARREAFEAKQFELADLDFERHTMSPFDYRRKRLIITTQLELLSA